MLTVAAPSSKDSLELENVCETGPFSLECYLAAIVDEATIQDFPNFDVADSEKSLTVSSSGGVHRKFAELKTDSEVSQARESTIPAKARPDTACECWMNGFLLEMEDQELVFHL